MYEHFFSLSAEPFRLSPDHRFCYNHEQYAKAKAYMAYAYLRAEGFVMVTGQPGTGKTTLVGDLIESLAGENVAVANLVSTQLESDDLLRMVAFAFGLPMEVADKSSVLQSLTTRFLALHREGGRALLIVDEAQDLASSAMEELRLLTNLQLDGQPLLQIFLLGQPELRDLIHEQGMEQVHQRIIAASHLRALGEAETRTYVEHRLSVVGWQNDPAISTAVFPIIHLFSEGVPRRINLICSRLFLHCCVEQLHQISVADARLVVAELQEEQLSTRNLLQSELFYAEDNFETPVSSYMAPAMTSLKTESASAAAAHRKVESAEPLGADQIVVGEPWEGAAPTQFSAAELTLDNDCFDSTERPQEVGGASTRVSSDVQPEESRLPLGQMAETSVASDSDNNAVWIILFAIVAVSVVVALIIGIDGFL